MLPSHVEAKQIVDLHQIEWAAPYIQSVVDQDIMTLGDNQQFQPAQHVTRQEAVKVIVKALELPSDGQIAVNAKDISPAHPSYEAFRKLIEIGVIDHASYVKPNAFVTRGQIAKMIARSFQIQVDDQNTASYSDVQHSWAKDYIESLADVGILQGKPDGQFAPYDALTRGQLAKIIVEAQLFKQQMEQLEVAYDYLGKRYIMTFQTNEEWGKETIEVINHYRAEHQVAPLEMDPYLNQLATIKVNDMIEREYFDHKSPYYGYAWDLASVYRYEFVSLGENLAKALTNPQEATKAWIASDTHRENILNNRYRYTGVAVAKNDNGKYYWVQLFSRK